MDRTRTCPQCGQAFTGRKDKTYCSPACRAQNHRDQLAAEAVAIAADEEDEEDAADVATPAGLVLPVTLASSPPGADRRRAAHEKQVLDELITELVSQSLQEHTAQATQQELHARYVRWVQTWLQQEGTPLSARLVSQLLRETERLSTSYQAHPAITQAQHPARLRLQLLYKIGDELRTLQQQLREKATSFFGASRSTDTLEFSKKRRGLLRESLLGAM